MNLDSKKSILALVLIIFVVGLRIVEHPFNATPMVAVMLFSAAIFKNWNWKIAVPLLALVLSDAAIELKNGYGFHSSTIMVYSTFAVIFTIGYFLIKKVNVLSVLTGSIVASTLFFLITNFAFFYPVALVPNPALGHYPHNLTGILASYQAGIPFFKNMLVGDIVFSGVLFLAYDFITKASWFSREKTAI